MKYLRWLIALLAVLVLSAVLSILMPMGIVDLSNNDYIQDLILGPIEMIDTAPSESTDAIPSENIEPYVDTAFADQNIPSQNMTEQVYSMKQRRAEKLQSLWSSLWSGITISAISLYVSIYALCRQISSEKRAEISVQKHWLEKSFRVRKNSPVLICEDFHDIATTLTEEGVQDGQTGWGVQFQQRRPLPADAIIVIKKLITCYDGNMITYFPSNLNGNEALLDEVMAFVLSPSPEQYDKMKKLVNSRDITKQLKIEVSLEVAYERSRYLGRIRYVLKKKDGQFFVSKMICSIG